MERELADYPETKEEEVSSLPSRKELRQTKRRSSRKRRKKKKNTIEFPLMRICLLLFFSIVTAMFTYPVWIDALP
ncbi:hypothetical protein [Alkalicoccus daliensis]|uniref:hypothetical protein n=1 Tax=Alkalicoccus daliensis TaxID=745820 RepID=UPI000B80A9F6|nr:hypothetical protein [Alkalicoccus daliensis]